MDLTESAGQIRTYPAQGQLNTDSPYLGRGFVLGRRRTRRGVVWGQRWIDPARLVTLTRCSLMWVASHPGYSFQTEASRYNRTHRY